MLTVCMCGMGTANATKLFATYGTPAGNGSWDVESETYSWTAGWNNLMTIFTFSNGELANYQSLHLKTDNYTDTYRVCFMNGSTTVATIAFYTAGQKNLVFSERTETKDLDLSQITHISFGGASGSGSIKLSNVYLVKPLQLEFDETGIATIGLSDIDYDTNLTFDEQTGVMTSNGQGTFAVSLNNEDFSSVSKIELLRSGDDIVQTLQVVDAENGTLNTWYGSKYSCNFVDYQNKANAVTRLSWNCNTAGSMTITGIRITANVIVATDPHVTPLTKDMFHKWTDASATATPTSDAVYPSYNLGTTLNGGDVVYGGNVPYLQYADATGYDKLVMKGTPGMVLRVLMNRQDSDSGPWTEKNPTFNENGDAELDLSEFEYVHINSIKIQWGNTGKVSEVSLYKTEISTPYTYVLTGSGIQTSSAKAALADETATLIDATKVSGSSLELTSANPNCIFVAKEGVLRNASNVAVDGVIAKMVVTDGYPMEVPASTIATAAFYSRKMANQYGTICLPFAVESSDAVKFYTLGEISGDVLTINDAATLPAGTPGIVEKVSGDAITCTGAGPLSNPVDVDGALKFYGSFEKKTIAAADYQGNIYAISNNKFVQAENQINLPAFRAFFAAESGEAKLRIAPNEDVTAINSLASEAASRVVGVYGVDGAQRNSLQKGMNVVKMSNGSVRKVYVK